MFKILQRLKGAFATHPILTNAVIYGTLFVGAECSQQVLSRKILSETSEPLDVPVLQRYALFGTCIQGPLLTVWYRWLDSKMIGSAYKTVAKKVLMDQFLMTPHLVWIFFVAMSLMESRPDVFEECKQKFVPTFKTSCMFWLPVQTVNFLFVPSAFRVVYVGTCSFAWVNILCYIKRYGIYFNRCVSNL